jgi:hypothetical protein
MRSGSRLVLKAFAHLHQVSGKCEECGEKYLLSTAEENEVVREAEKEIKEKGYEPRKI